MRSLRSLLVRSVARLLVASCAVAGLSPALLSLSADGGLAVAETAYAQAGVDALSGTLAGVQNSVAEGAAKNPTPWAALTNKFIDAANGIVQAAFMLMNPVLMFASWLLSPDWTFGDVFNMRPVLHDLWVLVSNIVYVIFAIALLVIAVLNIFGNQTWQIKSKLPRFVGGIILVPMSWFIVSAILSISNILTASMLNLPYDTFIGQSGTDLRGNNFIQEIGNFTIKNDCTLNFESQPQTATWVTASGTSASKSGKTIDCKGDLRLADMFSSDGSPYSILYVYAYGIFRVDTLQEITPINAISKAGDIVFGLFTGLVGFVIMLLLIIGIVFVLLTRVLQLWVFSILSPLFGLFFFLGVEILGDSDLKNYTIKNFISLAMVPVYISAALSFGMMLVLTVATSTVTPDETTGTSYIKMGTTPDGKDETIVVGNNQDESKRFKLTVKGAPLALGNGVGQAGQIGAGTIGKLIVMILALMVLWLAVVAGSKSSTITASAIEPIESFGKSIGGTITKLPQYIPIPLGGDKSMSYAGLKGFGSQISAIGSNAESSGTAFGRSVASSIGETLGIKVNEAAQNGQAAITKQNSRLIDATSHQNAAQGLTNVMQSIAQSQGAGTLAEVAANDGARKALGDAIEKMRILGPDAEKFSKEVRANITPVRLAEILDLIDGKVNGLLGGTGRDWDATDAANSWASLSVGSTPVDGNAGAPNAPRTPPVTTYTFAPANPVPMTGAGVTAETIATGINTQFPADKKTDSVHLAGLKAWIEVNVPVAVRDDVIRKLKDAGYDESKLR